MPTAAQVQANRANAHRSTGPRTHQGKQTSASNATRDGLTSTRLIVRPGEEQAYNSLREKLASELDPNGEFQTQYFEVILHAAWNIQRCIALEGDLQLQAFENGSPDAMLDDQIAPNSTASIATKRCTKTPSAKPSPNSANSSRAVVSLLPTPGRLRFPYPDRQCQD